MGLPRKIDVESYFHSELPSLLIILSSVVREDYITVEDLVVSYNFHSEMWEGSIYGDRK